MKLQAPEYIRTLVPYLPGKPIQETQRELKISKVVKLASNENPLGPSPRAVAAMKKGITDLHRYPDGGAFSLKAALSAQLGVTSSQILVGNGSDEVADMVVRTFCLPGDSILTHRAAFVAYRICAQAHGVQTLEAPVDDSFQPDLDQMLKLARENERVRAVFIANPNNPTGAYVTEKTLRGFIQEISKIRGGSILVVLDYAYWEYVTASDLPDPMKLLAGFPQNVLVMRTFSKVYGLAALRVGYGVSHEEIIGTIERIRKPFNVNALGQVAATAALGDRAFVKRSCVSNEVAMRYWENQLMELGIPFWKSQGNFILADVQKGLGKTGPEVYQECLKKGVILRPVANYGLPGAIRISLGTSPENRFAARVLAALKGVRLAERSPAER